MIRISISGSSCSSSSAALLNTFFVVIAPDFSKKLKYDANGLFDFIGIINISVAIDDKVYCGSDTCSSSIWC